MKSINPTSQFGSRRQNRNPGITKYISICSLIAVVASLFVSANAFAAAPIEDATLSLTRAFAVRTDTFRIYGLNDNLNADTWQESLITYQNAPGLSFSGNYGSNDIDPDKATLLGTASAATQIVTLSGAALDHFLNSDTDGFVTFIMTDTLGQAPGPHCCAFVFHSREGVTPPTLSIGGIALTAAADAPVRGPALIVEQNGCLPYLYMQDYQPNFSWISYVKFDLWGRGETDCAGVPDLPPTADAGEDQSIRAGDTVYLDGSASFDDNTASVALGYEWTFFSTPTGSTATLSGADTAMPSFEADVAGTYTVELVVTDEGGLPSDPATVEISSDNLAPTAVATVDYSLAIVGEASNFYGSYSTDPEGDPLTYSWAITAAPAGSTAALVGEDMALASLTTDVEGGYQVTLTVSDFIGPGTPATVSLVAVTPVNFAEIQIIAACDLVEALLPGQVTTRGNQRAFCNFLAQAISHLQEGEIADAIAKLDQAIGRTDGCPLRGSPDGNGPGRDWITDCVAQETVYGLLISAVDALQN